jgi:hypothetical protein
MLGSLFIQNFSRINTPTFLKPSHFHTYLPMKTEQSVPKLRHIKFRRREITQKKSIQQIFLLLCNPKIYRRDKKKSLHFLWPSRMQSTASLPVVLSTIFLPPAHNFFNPSFPLWSNSEISVFFYLETAEQLRPKRFIQRRFERRTPGMKHCKTKAI